MNFYPNPDDDIYCHPVMKPRSQELAERRRQKEFPGLDDDLKMIVRRHSGTIVQSVEHVPSQDDAQTMSSEEWKKMHEYRNTKQGRYLTWH